jgi:hypothetical protein
MAPGKGDSTMALRFTTLVFSLALAASAAAASPPADQEARLALLTAHAGEPVQRVRFLRPMHRVEVLDPSHVLVWETQSKAWLLELRDGKPCPRLDWGITVTIETLSDSINVENGHVVSKDGIHCRITSLREVDVPAFRAAEAAQDSGGT